MGRILAVVAICLMALAPVSVHAQQPAQPAPTQMPMAEASTGKLVAIGIGAVLGAMIVGAPMAAHGAGTVLGAVAGGVIGAWWYNEHYAPPVVRTP